MDNPAPQRRRSRAIALAVGTSLLSKGGNALIMLLAYPLAYRVLGEERFGIFGALQTLMWFLYMSDLGMGPGMTRRIAQAVARGEKPTEQAVISSGFFITLGLAAVAAVVCSLVLACVPVTSLFGSGFAPHAAELTRNLWISAGLFLAMLVLSTLDRAREGYQEIHISNGFGAINNVLIAVLLLTGISTFPTVTYLLLSIYGTSVIMSAVNSGHLLWKRPWLWPRFGRMDAALSKRMMAEGLALFIAGSIAPTLQREGTKFLLGHMGGEAGPALVARFTLLVQLGFFLFGFVVMFSRPLWPAFADASERGDHEWIRGIRRRIVLLWGPLSILAVAGFTVLGPWFTGVWLRKPVDLDRLEFFAFALMFALMVWSYLHYVMLAGCGVARQPAILLAGETVLVLALAYWGISHWGLAGGLLGNAIGMLLVSAWAMPRLLSAHLATHPGPAKPSAGDPAAASHAAPAVLPSETTA